MVNNNDNNQSIHIDANKHYVLDEFLPHLPAFRDNHQTLPLYL